MDNLTLAIFITLPIVIVLLTVLFLIVRIKKNPIYGMLTKILPSLGFVLFGVLGLTLRFLEVSYGAPLIVMGLVLGLVGDILLDLKRAHKEFEESYLWTGMYAFIIGHVFYLAGFLLIADVYDIDLLLPTIVPLAIAAVMAPVTLIVSEKVIKAEFGKFRIISTAYAGLLVYITVVMVWLAATNTEFILPAIGMVLFLFSDLVLSQMYFVKGKAEDKSLVIINHSAYYAAQILIAASLFIL
ncbi:MAG: lysoplasmalogenase [Endomicrobium sp.]|jgi:uncharacterized membrane protein YhhN|nr:lysoplasmalogenase [Endomicrobium sp.]